MSSASTTALHQKSSRSGPAVGIRHEAFVTMSSEVHRSPSYYFAIVVFQVEDMLFRVPRRYFEQESEVFRAMFQLPVASGTVPDGMSDEQPLRLEGVNKEDFHQLLRIMFPDRPLKFEALSTGQWTSVLKLTATWQMDGLTQNVLQRISHLASGHRETWIDLLDASAQYHLPEVRAAAIRELSKTFTGHEHDAGQVVLARKYQVKSWLQEGLTKLIRRRRVLSDDDAEILGWKLFGKIYRAREQYFHDVVVDLGFRLNRAADAKRPVDLETEFGDELSEMGDEAEVA